jgi:asparagine synthase (glutamine-hydrolysing)
MPGIAGIVGKKSPTARREIVASMIDTMRHDASYVSDIHSVADCDACVACVAHPDSFARRCSGAALDGLVLGFAGECFPTLDGRAGSNEPLDVLQRYREEGPAFVKSLNGLFSGVLIDPQRPCVLLFNDRYGAERIYFHIDEDSLYFASEAKALLSAVPELRALDEEGVAQFLAYGSIRGGTTLFRGVQLVPGGSLWTLEPGSAPRQERYFDPAEWEAQAALSTEEFESAFVDTAHAVFPWYAKAASPVGISITGGLDTRMLMACLPPEASPVCYTYGALSGDTFDVRIGRRVAHAMGLEHHTLRVSADFVSNFPEYVERTAFVTDGCCGALGAHEIFLSGQARGLAPIRVTGNYGSEVLRSVQNRKPLTLPSGMLSPEFQARVQRSQSAAHARHPLTETAFDEVPLHLFGPLAAARSQLIFRTPYLDNAVVKLAYRAPPESRHSPSSALRLIATGSEALGRIPTDRGFSCGRSSPLAALRRLFCWITFKLDYMDKEGLPPELSFFDNLRGPLAGIGLLGLHKFLPYRRWFRNELAPYIADTLRSSTVMQQPWWNSDFLATMGEDHQKGRRNYVHELDIVLTLDAIERTLIRGWPKRTARSMVVDEVVAQ